MELPSSHGTAGAWWLLPGAGALRSGAAALRKGLSTARALGSFAGGDIARLFVWKCWQESGEEKIT